MHNRKIVSEKCPRKVNERGVMHVEIGVAEILTVRRKMVRARESGAQY